MTALTSELTSGLPARTRRILEGSWSMQSTWACVSSVGWSCYKAGLSFEQFSDVLWRSDLGQHYYAKNNFKTRQQFDKNVRSAWDSADEKLDWGFQPRPLRERLSDLLGRVQQSRWPGNGGGSERAVAEALVTIAHELNKYTVDVTVRELAARTGFGRTAVTGAVKRLAVKKLFTVGRCESETHRTSNYQLNLDWYPLKGNKRTYKDVPPTSKYVLLLPLTIHPAFAPKALGQSARRLWFELLETPEGATAKALAERTGLRLKTVRGHLDRMIGHGLLVKTGVRNAVFTVHPEAALDAVAVEYGTSGWNADRFDRFEREREGYLEDQRQRAERAARGEPEPAQRKPVEAEQRVWREQARQVLSPAPVPQPDEDEFAALIRAELEACAAECELHGIAVAAWVAGGRQGPPPWLKPDPFEGIPDDPQEVAATT
jgi:DNA-binding MarR family transcriptional regulator